MSDAWLVFGALWIFYLLEGVWWAPHQAVSFSRGLFGAFTRACPVRLRRDARSGAILPHHLVATGERYVASGWPLRISPLGMRSLGEDPRRISYEDVHALWTSGARVLFEGKTFATTPSPRAARDLVRFIRELSESGEERRRERLVEFLDRALDHREARRQARRMRVVLRRSRWLSIALFGNLFVLAPAVVALAGAWAWPLPAALHLVLSVVAAVVFCRASTRLYPDRRENRLSPVLTMLLYPPFAARYAELLSRNLIADLHPMAVAAALDRETLESLARHMVVESRKRLMEEDDVDAWFRRAKEERMLNAVERYGLNPRALARAPQPEAGAVAYCPLCHAQYRSALPDCVDCEGIPLVFHGAG